MRPIGIGEIAPTAGFAPRWRDLVAPHHGPTLEQALCAQLGLPDIEIVGSGTAGLLIAFAYLKGRSQRRRTVIVPGYTCPLVVIAAAAAGLQTIACDTVTGGFELDADHLARLVDNETLAVVPTHYGGALTDIARVRAIATSASREVAIIEDAAQAFGATWQGRSVGLAGDIGVFSFGAGKGFTIYEGGGLVARDAEIMAGLRQVATELRSGSALGEAWRALLLIGYHAAYNPLGLRGVYGAPKRFWLRVATTSEPRAINLRCRSRSIVWVNGASASAARLCPTAGSSGAFTGQVHTTRGARGYNTGHPSSPAGGGCGADRHFSVRDVADERTQPGNDPGFVALAARGCQAVFARHRRLPRHCPPPAAQRNPECACSGGGDNNAEYERCLEPGRGNGHPFRS